MYRHLMILEFALSSLFRRKYKNFLMISVYSMTVFLLASLVFLTDSLKTESVSLLESTPELIIQNLKGGRHDLIPEYYATQITNIRGVGQVLPRNWGYYFDPAARANYTFWGCDEIEQNIGAVIEGSIHIDQKHKDKTLPCIIGKGVSEIRFIGVNDLIPVKGSDGALYILKVAGIFNSQSSILTNDLVVMSQDTIKTLFEIPENMATDLAVRVKNPSEIDTVALKIQKRFPSVRIISRKQIRNTYEALFSWRSGLMAALLLSSIATFAILTWDKALGTTDTEKKEIGILKAVGWSTPEVLELKFFEGAAVSVVSFLTGMTLAYIHVFYWGGSLFVPILRGWSVLFPKLTPIPLINIYNILSIAFLTVFPYIASTIIPFWKTAVTDPDMVMK